MLWLVDYTMKHKLLTKYAYVCYSGATVNLLICMQKRLHPNIMLAQLRFPYIEMQVSFLFLIVMNSD